MRVLIVDDHPIIVAGCAAMLAGKPRARLDRMLRRRPFDPELRRL